MRVITVAPACNPGSWGTPPGQVSGNLPSGRTIQPTPQVLNSAPQVLPTMSTAQFLQKRIDPEEVVMQEGKQADPESTKVGEPSPVEDKTHDQESIPEGVSRSLPDPLGTETDIESPKSIADEVIQNAEKLDPSNPNVTPDPNS
jgi:hypothetical protein